MSPKKKRRVDAAHFGDTEAGGSSQVFNIGHINADAVSLHPAATQKEQPLEPLSTVPFPRDPNFVGRQSVLDAIDQHLSDENAHQRLALYGIGGVGKSQIVIEYTYRKRQKSPGTWIFWIYCNQPKDFEQSYYSIATKLRLPEGNSSTADTLNKVQNWLDDKRNGPWLIILDNVDDSSVLQEYRRGPEQRSLLSYIPTSEWGKVLSTSRDRVAAFNLTGDYNRLIQIEEMGNEESILLLESKVPIASDERKAASRLVEALDHIPLAITQAGAYIREMEPLTVADYVKDLLNANEEDQATLLNQEIKDLRRHESVSSAVFQTWHMSFAHIRQKFPETADLLSLLCVFHRQDIGERLIVADGTMQRRFRECASKLKNYSLVSLKIDWTISMHRLVQLATRAWLVDQKTTKEYQCRAIRLLDKFSPVDLDIQLHLEELVEAQPDDEYTSLCIAKILHTMAWKDWIHRRYDLSMRRAERSSQIRRRYQGPYHPNILSNTWLLGTCYREMGKIVEAEQYFKKYVEGLELTNGRANLDTLRAKERLAELYYNQDHFDESESRFTAILEALGAPEYKGFTIFALRIMYKLVETCLARGRHNQVNKVRAEISRLKRKS